VREKGRRRRERTLSNFNGRLLSGIRASEGVIRRPYDSGYGDGCGKERRTGSGNGAPCYWEDNEAGDLDLAPPVSRSQGNHIALGRFPIHPPCAHFWPI
jgi:hypothetical protein